MEDSIKVYSLPSCGMCKALKMALDDRDIKFEDCQDVQYMSSIGIRHTPILEYNGQRYNFKEAMALIKEGKLCK